MTVTVEEPEGVTVAAAEVSRLEVTILGPGVVVERCSAGGVDTSRDLDDDLVSDAAGVVEGVNKPLRLTLEDVTSGVVDRDPNPNPRLLESGCCVRTGTCSDCNDPNISAGRVVTDLNCVVLLRGIVRGGPLGGRCESWIVLTALSARASLASTLFNLIPAFWNNSFLNRTYCLYSSTT